MATRSTTAAPGLATEGNAPVVIWRHEGVCTAGPGPDIPPIDVIENYWGRTTLILMGVVTLCAFSLEAAPAAEAAEALGEEALVPFSVDFLGEHPTYGT